MLPTHRRCDIVVQSQTITTLVSSTLTPYLCLSCYRGIGGGKRRSLAYAIRGAEASFEPHKDIL